eukprot:403354296
MLLAYFLSNLIDVVNRSQSQVVNSIYKKDLSFDSTEINLNVDNFDMGIFVSYFGTKDGVQEQVLTEITSRTYFTTNVFQVFFQDNPNTWGTGNDWQQTPINLEIFKEGRFLNENSTAKLTDITGNYLCPTKDFQLKLQGTMYNSSKTAYLIYVTVDYCDQEVLDIRNPNKNLKFKTELETDEILPYMNIFFAYISQYFDHNNYSENPIVNNIQLNYWPLNKFISNNQMMKYFLGSQYLSQIRLKYTKNEVTTRDSWLTTNLFSKDYIYYTGRLEYTQIGTRELAATWSLFSVEIDMDEGFVLTERSVMTILDAFSIVGGMMGITFTFTQYLIEKFQESMFLASIIGKIFYQSDTKISQKNSKIPKVKTPGNESQLEISFTSNKSIMNFSPKKLRVIQSVPEQHISSARFTLENNKVEDKKLPIHKQIFNFIRSLSPFKFSFKDLMAYKAKRCCLNIICRRKAYKNMEIKYQLYQKAKGQIEKEFDVVRMMKSMRRVDLIFKTLFSKSQAFFIPILKDNVLNEKKILSNLQSSSLNQNIPIYLKNETILSSIDDENKLIDSIDLSQYNSVQQSQNILQKLCTDENNQNDTSLNGKYAQNQLKNQTKIMQNQAQILNQNKKYISKLPKKFEFQDTDYQNDWGH